MPPDPFACYSFSKPSKAQPAFFHPFGKRSIHSPDYGTNKAVRWKRILDDHGLQPVAYAGGLRREMLQVCQWLGIPHSDGGLRVSTPEEATAL